MRRVYLDVPFLERNLAKVLAYEAGSRVRWDRKLRRWYWVGLHFPEVLKGYLPRDSSSGDGAEVLKLSITETNNKPSARYQKRFDFDRPSGEVVSFDSFRKKKDGEVV